MPLPSSILHAIRILVALAASVSTAVAQSPVRVATWNIESVGEPGSGQYRAAALVLNRVGADVVAINEVNGNVEAGYLETLASETGYEHVVVPTTNPFGSLRNGFISRLPLRETVIHTSGSISGDGSANDLTRLIIEVVVDVPDTPIDLTLVTNHLKASTTNADEFRRACEAARFEQVVADLAGSREAFVILGDMNAVVTGPPGVPNPFVELPTGLPQSFRLGLDLREVLYREGGIINDPFHYMGRWNGPATTVLDARQMDGFQGTHVSGRRIDYILASHRLSGACAPAEVYDSADEQRGGGLPKYGDPLPPGISAAASDHLIVFADLVVPRREGSHADRDGDGDADLADAAAFQTCFTGPGRGPLAEPCRVFDVDCDDDVDFVDHAALIAAVEAGAR